MKNNRKCTQTLYPYIIHICIARWWYPGFEKKILFTLSKHYPQYKVNIVHIAKFEKDLAFSNGNYTLWYKKLQECLDENRYSILLSWPFVIMQIRTFISEWLSGAILVIHLYLERKKEIENSLSSIPIIFVGVSFFVSWCWKRSLQMKSDILLFRKDRGMECDQELEKNLLVFSNIWCEKEFLCILFSNWIYSYCQILLTFQHWHDRIESEQEKNLAKIV